MPSAMTNTSGLPVVFNESARSFQVPSKELAASAVAGSSSSAAIVVLMVLSPCVLLWGGAGRRAAPVTDSLGLAARTRQTIAWSRRQSLLRGNGRREAPQLLRGRRFSASVSGRPAMRSRCGKRGPSKYATLSVR